MDEVDSRVALKFRGFMGGRPRAIRWALVMPSEERSVSVASAFRAAPKTRTGVAVTNETTRSAAIAAMSENFIVVERRWRGVDGRRW